MKTKTQIKDYLLIGGLRSSALISKTGSIDWLCLPYFDSPSVFAELLDSDSGSFSIDTADYATTSDYVAETAIAETVLENTNAKICLHDFMVPLDTLNLEANQYLVRRVSCLKGSAKLIFKLNLQPNYARDKTQWHQEGSQLVSACGQGWLVLRLPKQAVCRKAKAGYNIELELTTNETEELILEYQPTRQKLVDLPNNFEQITLDFWRSWVAKGSFVEFCRAGLVRSAITLKLMQFAPTGAIVAAPTTSLPETIGGVRNWDYRYVWIRDATFTLYAFYILGYEDEAEHFFNFIHNIVEVCDEQSFEIELMYTIFGKPVPSETNLDNLAGFANSSPVRIGNGAAQQFQLDVYGSLIDAIYFATKRGITDERKAQTRKLVMHLVHKIDERWQTADSGIWEVRPGRQHFTYSKVMSWVGADRANRLQAILKFSNQEAELCQSLARKIKDSIWQDYYKPEINNFSQYPDTDAIDATNFLFVLLQFLDKHDPKTKEIIDRTRQSLCHNQVFVYRYLSQDGLPGKEGAFVLCSFWLISALAILEDTDEALKLFNKLESLLSPNGLIAEEIDTKTNEYLGNYPQAFSQIGYVMSAYYLDKYLKRQASNVQA